MAALVTSEERKIEVTGGEVFVKIFQPLTRMFKSPLIMLHDSLGCVDMWRDLPAILAEKTGRTVIAYDRLGFGRSSQRTSLPSVHFVSEEASVLSEILQTLGVGKFALFGHSVGGGMSIAAAGFFGERCEAIITESAQAFVEDRTREGIHKAEKDFADPKVFAKLRKYHGDKTQWVLDAWVKVWLSEAFADWSLKSDLPKMKCPVLIIHGDRDEYGSRNFPEMIYSLAGGEVQMELLFDCGHVPHREKPDIVTDLIVEFLK